ncbi:trace amine-associated receptor 1-like [Mastacembelus armatus]|uniref:trace amine-associated receptor 1-like n=1 Tax=Mastacembelus armatus TaxID=205130 RepID=UPI0014367116|nr:trace amine-associated receptor 1-like [Mastacembelus armatus]
MAISPITIRILLGLLYGCVSVVITCGNLLVIISITYFKQLHTATNSLVLSLAVADLLVGIVICPFSMAQTESSCWYYESLLCKVKISFDIALNNSSILHLCCISVDRYYAVCQPLRYKTKINVDVATIMILVSWSVSIMTGIGVMIAGFQKKKCVGSCPVHIQIISTFVSTASFYFPASVMLSIYLKIFQVAQKQAHSIQNTVSQSTKSGVTVSKMERKATKTLATVMGVFLTCWTPFFLCITFQPVSNYAIPVSVIETFSWLGRSNSMLNPFVYAFFYSWFRSAFRMIISGKIFQGDFANSKLH